MSVLLYLVLGHLIADYPLQGDFLGKMKSTNIFLLWTHVIMYSLVIGLVLDHFGMYTNDKLILLIISHFVIDYWKCRIANITNPNAQLTTNLYIDQGLHIIVLLLCVYTV